MSFLFVLWFACLLDLLFGDPRWFPHPVRLFGWFATRMELFTRSLAQNERNSGRLTVLLLLLVTGSICAAALTMLSKLSLPGFLAGAAFVLYTTIAARDLIRHARRVYDALATGLESARSRVALTRIFHEHFVSCNITYRIFGDNFELVSSQKFAKCSPKASRCSRTCFVAT